MGRSPRTAGHVERLRVQTRSIKWVAYIVLAIVIALTLAAGVAGWWYIRQVNPAGEAGEAVSFTVNEDDTLRTISERLEEQDLVVDAGLFRWYVDRHGGLEVIPGYYAIQTSDHMGNVLARLRTPPNQTYSKVTFPEGFTVNEIAARLGEEIVPMRARRFLRAANDPEVVSAFRPEGITSLEGLLFPDTYQVSNGENEAQVVERMIGLMERVANQEDIEIKAEAPRPEPVRHPDHRLDDRGGGQARRGPPEDRPGHLQPARARHAAGDRRRGPVRHRAERARPGQGPVRRAAGDPRAVQHLRQRRACPSRRSPTPVGRRSRPP